MENCYVYYQGYITQDLRPVAKKLPPTAIIFFTVTHEKSCQRKPHPADLKHHEKRSKSNHRRCSLKKGILNILQNSQENTYTGISFQ